MSTAYDVAILGAGIVGAACALECASRGLRTVVTEGRGVGSGATAAGMGHIVVMDDSEAQLALTRYSQTLWHALAARLPDEVEFDRCGTLWVAADEEEMQEVRRKQAVYVAAGVAAEILGARGLEEAEPHLRRPMAGALLVPGDAVLYPPCTAAWLLQEARRMGAEFVAESAVGAVAGGVLLSGGSELQAAHIVIACGADSTDLLPALPIRKRKGHLVITDRYPGMVRHQLVELGYLKSAHSLTADSVAFNVQPRRTGQLLIGSSRQFGDESREVDHGILARMLQRAEEYLPEIGGCSAIRVWTGFRAATPDKLPLIGPWPDDESLMLATGHEGLGITTSLGTGRLVADLLTGTVPEIAADAYRPGRFLSGAGTEPEVARGGMGA
ncbi:MAG TPA: FAD-dependent oxidoreductase [Acidobacteriaceae bacterium]|jgi:glycine/D-amino acid oxidase-like deaminating enzyme|nr:FAD-dependent oxidoreductase [Acidobacteriaceae bacterium]